MRDCRGRTLRCEVLFIVGTDRWRLYKSWQALKVHESWMIGTQMAMSGGLVFDRQDLTGH